MAQRPEGLKAAGLRARYATGDVLKGLDITIAGAAFTVLIGPNGSGKSTLLRCLAGLKPPSAGEITLDGKAVASFARRIFARRVSFLPQTQSLPEELRVVDLVRQGRYPHRSLFSGWSGEDEAICARALALTSMTQLSQQPLRALSGGQRQLARIAMSLAQESDILLLDEPTSFLDIAHQVELLQLLQRLVFEEGKTVVAVLHDLNQALHHADRVVMMASGQLHAEGLPAEVADPETIAAVFGLRCRVVIDPVDSRRIIVPGD